MKHWINEIINEKAKIFLFGCVPGLFTGITLLYAGTPHQSLLETIVFFIAKVFATFILALASGCATILGSDLIAYIKKKNKARKRKKLNRIKNGIQKRA